MPVLMEQERLLGSEDNLINVATQYTVAGNAAFQTIHDYGNITLASDGIVIFKFDAGNGTGNPWIIRIKIGSTYVYANGAASGGLTGIGAAFFLTAGTYDVLAEAYWNSAGNLPILNFQLGYVAFNDMVGQTPTTYSSGIAKTVAARNTPAGALNQANYRVQVFAQTPAGVTNMENIGDNLTNGVSVLIDGVQVSWNERYQDTNSKQAASANVTLPYSVGSSHTVTFSKRNANTVITVSIIACPWILSATAHNPITPNFSLGTTLYCTLNAMHEDPTKVVGIGVPRAVDWGNSYDYYSTTSGTGLLQFSYVWDTPDQTQVQFFTSGLGGCIEIIGADVR